MSVRPEQAGLFGPDARKQAAREAAEDREAEHREAVAHNRKARAMTYKTALGDRVPRFPKTDPLRQAAADAYAALVEAYDEAEKAKAVQGRMSSASAVDHKRFPVLGGGDD